MRFALAQIAVGGFGSRSAASDPGQPTTIAGCDCHEIIAKALLSVGIRTHAYCFVQGAKVRRRRQSRPLQGGAVRPEAGRGSRWVRRERAARAQRARSSLPGPAIHPQHRARCGIPPQSSIHFCRRLAPPRVNESKTCAVNVNMKRNERASKPNARKKPAAGPN